MGPQLLKGSFHDIYHQNQQPHGNAINTNHYAMKAFLSSVGIKVLRVLPMQSFGNTEGYMLELDGNGYCALRHLN